jgi:putative transposase
VTRYRCVDAQKAAGFPVAAACTAAGVSRAAYYAWAASARQRPSDRDQEESRLLKEIRAIHARSQGTYGSPRMTAELRRRGWRVNHKRVERLMRLHGIVGYRPRRRRSLTKPDQAAPPAPDLLGRLFDPDQPNLAWCGDVTYVPTDQGWLYLASVLDLGSRRLLGYAMGERHDAALVVDALEMALATRGRRQMDGTIFHTDRGSEYTAAATVAACERLGLTRSMGRTASCLDNAAAESWFASLKVELEGGAGRPRSLPNPSRSPHGHLRLDRLAQPWPAALGPPVSPTRRVGESIHPHTAATIDNGRIARCPASRGKSRHQSSAASGRTISDLMKQCSRHNRTGTTSQQRSTLPTDRQGHDLCSGLNVQEPRVLTRRRLPIHQECAGWLTPRTH